MPDWRWTSKRIWLPLSSIALLAHLLLFCHACTALARTCAASDAFNACLPLGFCETFATVVLALCADASVRPFMPAWCLLGPLLHQ